MANEDRPKEVFNNPFSFKVCNTIAVEDSANAREIANVVFHFQSIKITNSNTAYHRDKKCHY